jgi:hypothetical protein
MSAPLIVSFGGGVNSSAMLVGLRALDIVPDLILFADTGAERPETYAHVEAMSAWTVSVGFPEIVTVRYVPPIAPYDSLEGNCLANETLPSLAFGMKSCSAKWKVKPQERYILAWLAERDLPFEWIAAVGLDATPADLRRQKAFAAQPSQKAGATSRFFLQEWGWNRERCAAEIAAAGIPVPPKSACFFCPAMHKDEIQELALLHPELHRRALDLEEKALTGRHNLRSTKGLGRRFAWRDVPVLAT